MTTQRRHFLQMTAASLLPLPFTGFAQASYPTKPIKIIVPLPAGGVADSSVRIMTDQLGNLLNQSVVVDNKPGGIFQIGMQTVGQAPADGYTLIHLNIGMLAAQASQKRFDLLKQLAPVCLMGYTDGTLFGSLAAPFKTTQEMITWARANPGKLNYGTSGAGSLEHLTMESLSRRYGFTGTHVPFKGGPDSMTALAQNEIQVMASAFPLIFQFGQKVRAMGMMTERRNALMPDIPTLKEQGIDAPLLQYWGGLGAPAGTPREVIDILQRNVATVIATPTTKSKYTPLGMNAYHSGPDEFAKLIGEDLKWMTATVKDADLKLN